MTAAAIDLCTLDEVKSFMGVSNTDTTMDAVLQDLITRFSQFASNYCSRIFQDNHYTQVCNGSGGYVQVLDQTPIIAVTSVTLGLTSVQLSTAPNISGYTFDDTAVYLRGGYYFPQGLKNVAIEYEAGYATIPADLSGAAVEQVVLKYRTKDRLGVTAKGIAGETISFSGADLTPSTKATLNIYQRASLT